MNQIPSWMSRTHLLLGDEKILKLMNAHVLVAGLGGVGGNCAEALVRAGIGEITIVDADVVEASNCNRQLVALNSTINKYKTEVLAERLLDINPDVKINVITNYLKEHVTEAILDTVPYTYAVDCIDTLSSKVYFIKGCKDRNIPLISSMGAGRKFDPTRIQVADIADSHKCPLARYVRKRLHKLKIYAGVKVVYSDELYTEDHIIVNPKGTPKRSFIGTISYIPAAFGLTCASVVIRDIAAIN